MKKTVYWIEGDGIGPEIWSAARPVTPSEPLWEPACAA